jgi:hypothetical protein
MTRIISNQGQRSAALAVHISRQRAAVFTKSILNINYPLLITCTQLIN